MKNKLDIFSWIGGGFFALAALVYIKESLIASFAFLALAFLILPITKNLFSFLNKPIKFVVGFLILMLAFGTIPETKKTENQKESPTPTQVIGSTETIIPTVFQESVELVKVVDGDTVMVKINGEEKSIRLIGINAPEANECLGKEATEKMKELIENKKIILEDDSSQDDKDKYGRLLRYIYLEDETLINKKMIEDGFAKEYTYKIAYKFQTEFKEAEKMAKEEEIGVWADNVCSTVVKVKTVETTIVPVKKVQSNLGFSCDCSKSCTQITSCEEAYFQLNNCGCSKRDSDGDGVPCESLCN